LALSAHAVPSPPPPPPPPIDWVVDSGASFHTTPTVSSLSHSHLPHPSHPQSIVVGNSSTLPVTSVGASVLPGPFHLNDILVAPGLTHPLLSIHRFTSDNHCSMEFDPWGLTICHLPSRAVLTRYDSSGPLYSLHSPSTSLTSVALHALATTTTSAVWHHRLKHPGPDVMSQLSSHSDISYSRGSSDRGGHIFYHKPKTKPNRTEPNRNFGFFGSSVRFRFLYLRSSVFGIVIGFHCIPNRKNRIPNFINSQI
jgi:hypothetical protein